MIQILTVGFLLNFIILFRHIKLDNLSFDFGVLRTMIIFVLKTIPFYILHGQIFNYVLMFYPFDDKDAGLVIYSRIVLISVGFITSLSHFTMPIFNNSLNNWNKFWKGLLITLLTSVIIVTLLLLFSRPIDYIFLGENSLLSSHRLIFVAIVILYPIYNYFVVNHYIVKNETKKLLFPLVLVNLPLLLFKYFNFGSIAPYSWILFCFLVLSLYFIFKRKKSLFEFVKLLRLS